MRCLICGTADAACGASELTKPVLGEVTHRRIGQDGNVVDVEPKPATDDSHETTVVVDIQADD